MQAHLGTDSFHRPGQEVSRPHPELERPKRVLYSLTPDAHDVRLVIQTSLHRIKDVFMLPARHSTLLAGSALRL